MNEKGVLSETDRARNRAYSAEWRKDPANLEYMREYAKLHYYANKEKKLALSKIWRDNNKEKMTVLQAKWAEENQSRRKSYHAEWYQKNKDRILVSQRDYYHATKTDRRPVNKAWEDKYGGGHHRRAEKRGNYSEMVDRIAIFERDKYKCFYCGKKLCQKTAVLEHKIPISKGGSNTVANCTTACGSCNSSKGAALVNGMQITIFDRPAE